MKAKKRDEKEGDESESKVSSEKLSFLKKSALAAILVIFALALTSGVASATTHVVNQTAACIAGDYYYSTIQAAVWNASGGDTIIVCPEATAYQETVDVNKSDINISAYNATKPVVSANGASDHVFNITNQENVTLQGFEIRDANGSTQDVAGIYLNNTNESKIIDNKIVNISSTSPNAYGIYLRDSSDNSVDPTVMGDLTAGDGNVYGIYLGNSDRNNFTDVSAPTGVSSTGGSAYGLYLAVSSNNNITNVSFGAISGDGDAAGVWMGSSNRNNIDPTMGDITGNGSHVYGLLLVGSSDNNITGVVFGAVNNSGLDAAGV